MRGTGSDDVFVSDVFIPEQHTALLSPLEQPGTAYQGPLYRLTVWVPVALLAPPALSIARAAIDSLIELARTRVRPGAAASAWLAEAVPPLEHASTVVSAFTAHLLTAGMRSRLERVASALGAAETSPRVFVTEWLEPPYSAGHWVPDMVSAARGTDVAGMSGEPSHRMRWPDVAALEPEVVVLAPCGFDLDRTLSEVVPLDLSAHLLGTPARQESRVFAVDANAMFSRPGPRLVDGVELLAYLLHPSEYSDPGSPWSRIRL